MFRVDGAADHGCGSECRGQSSSEWAGSSGWAQRGEHTWADPNMAILHLDVMDGCTRDAPCETPVRSTATTIIITAMVVIIFFISIIIVCSHACVTSSPMEDTSRHAMRLGTACVGNSYT